MLDLQNGEAEWDRDELKTKIARSPGRYRAYFGANENWVANNDYSVTLNLPRVNLDAALLLSDERSSGIMSRDHWDAVGGEVGYQIDPVGNGPWSYVHREIDGTFLHERVEDHWRITPAFHELELIQVREASPVRPCCLPMRRISSPSYVPIERLPSQLASLHIGAHYPPSTKVSASPTSEISLSAATMAHPTAPSLLLRALSRLRA